MKKRIVFGEGQQSSDDIVALVKGEADAFISTQAAFVGKIEAGERLIQRLLRDEGKVDGVTTGYGDSCIVKVPYELTTQLPVNLTRFHGCGLGEMFSAEQSQPPFWAGTAQALHRLKLPDILF